MLNNFLNEGLVGKSKSTKRTYEYVLKQFKTWLNRAGTDLSHFSRTDVQQYLDFLTANKKSPATIHKSWNAIKKYCLFINNIEAIQDVSLIKPPNYLQQAPKALTRKERNRLLREVDRTGDKRNYAIVVTLLNTGVRVSELANLDLTDIEMTERKGTLKIVGKGYRERTIPLNSETRRSIKNYLEIRDKNSYSPALFLSNRGKRISTRTIQHLFNKYGFHVHQTRHTFITDLHRSGVDLPIIQSLSGHQSVEMLSRYSQPTEEEKANTIEKLYKH